MTERAYITVDRAESPRLIEVAEISGGGADTATMQDLHDTLNSNTLPAGDSDDSLGSMDDDFLVRSTGKDDLGGGTQTGINLTLQNAQVAFAGNYVPAQIGFATSANGAGTQLTDTAATFTTNGVKRGYWIVNFTDMSVTEVLSVTSETVLQHRALQSGTADNWSVNDNYAIFEVVQKELSGGNALAVDGLDASISPVFPGFATQVILARSVSATLQEQQDIQYASFGGGVTIDVLTGLPGTVFPAGTPRQPSDNTMDAHTILNERGFDTFFVIGNLTISSGTHPHHFVGQAPSLTTMTLDAAPNLTGARFSNSTITGTLDGDAAIISCTIQALNFFNGEILQCVLDGVITLGGGVDALILDCWGGVTGGTINLGGSGQSLQMQNYNGDITLTNKTGAEGASIGMGSGGITIDDTVTNGVLTLTGVGAWYNEATYSGGATIVNELLTAADAQAVSFGEGVTVDVVNGVSGVAHPRGTTRLPTDNLTDAIAIAALHSLKKIKVIGDLTIGMEGDWTGFTFIGENVSRTTLTVLATATTAGFEAREATVTGTISGAGVHLQDCNLLSLTTHSGEYTHCGLADVTTLTGDSTSSARFVGCYGAGDPAGQRPEMDCGGDGPLITIVRYAGGLTIRNKTGLKAFGIIMAGGLFELENTVTAGTVVIAGVLGTFTNNSAGVTVLEFFTTANAGIIATLDANTYDGKSFSDLMIDVLAHTNGQWEEDPPGSGVVKCYAQDNTTVLYTLTKAPGSSIRTRS